MEEDLKLLADLMIRSAYLETIHVDQRIQRSRPARSIILFDTCIGLTRSVRYLPGEKS
jgi:hypothetical protein